jgi:topoisomerase IA-like protein
MAKYSRSAGKEVKSALHRRKKHTLKSGPGGKGGTVTSRKQAIAIGLSEARAKGKKVPSKRKTAKRKTAKRKTAKRKTTKTAARRKTARRKRA